MVEIYLQVEIHVQMEIYRMTSKLFSVVRLATCGDMQGDFAIILGRLVCQLVEILV